MKAKTILAISPHIDDIELSCGATLHKLIEQGNNLSAVIITDCRSILRNTPFKPDANQLQCQESLQTLSFNKKNIFINHLKELFLFKHSRKIFDILENLRQKLHPDIIFIPSPNDTHQDHSSTAKEAITVFRRETSIFLYEQPWNNIKFNANYFSVVNDLQMDKKIQALKNYKVQYYYKRPYFEEDFIRGWARTRGSQANQKYAEAFEIIKLIES